MNVIYNVINDRQTINVLVVKIIITYTALRYVRKLRKYVSHQHNIKSNDNQTQERC